MKIRVPDLVSIYGGERLDFLSDRGSVGDISYKIEPARGALTVTLAAESTPVGWLRLRWRFAEGERPPERARIYGDAWERGGGTLEWHGVVPERCMPWYFIASTGSDSDACADGREHFCFGVNVCPAALCFWQYDGGGLTLWADVRCGGEGVVLGGRELRVCEIVFAEYFGCSAYEAGRRFCAVMSPSPLPLAEPVYGANNWYHAYGESSEADILREARQTAELCAGCKNRPFMVIDDGWSPNPKNGPWTHGRASFPDMPGLADKIAALGMKSGIWTRFMYDEGRVCGLPEEWHLSREPAMLDPSRPEVLEYVRQTAERFAGWGYGLIKYDCSAQDILGRRGYRVSFAVAEDGWSFSDRARTSAEIIMSFYRAVRAGAGDKTVLLGCATIPHLCAGLVHIGRTGADVNGRSWDITRRMGVNTLAFRMMQHGSFFAADADCAGITGALPWPLMRQWLWLLANSGTPLFVSCRPGALTASQTEELRAAYAAGSLQTAPAVPLDWMENICPERWLISGREKRFDWFDDGICATFEP